MKHLISTLTLLVALGSGIHALSAVPASEHKTEATDLSTQGPVLSGASTFSTVEAPQLSTERYAQPPAPYEPTSSDLSLPDDLNFDLSLDAREEKAGEFFIGGFRRRRRRPIVRVVRPIYIRPRPRRRPRRPRRRPGRNINVNGANGGFNYGGNGANGGNIRVTRDNVDPESGADTSVSTADALNLNTGAVTAAKREQEVDDQRRRPGNVNVNGANGGYNVGGNGANGGNISVSGGRRRGGNTNVRGANGGTNYYGNGANGGNIRVNRG